MRAFRLARVAAQAEVLRLRRFLRRQAVRAALGATAAVFLLGCLAWLHVTGYFALLRAGILPLWGSLILAGVDVVIGLFFGLLALRDSPGRVEREALEVRRTAQAEMTEAAAMTAVVGPLLRSLGLRRIYAVALAALMARFFGGAARH
jgi:hypothetical protein